MEKQKFTALPTLSHRTRKEIFMNFQATSTQLLDAIYQAASERMTTLDPRHAHNAYLKVLLKPLSPEARVWINSDFSHFGNHIHYEIFRPLSESDKTDLRLQSLYYQKTSAAISGLMLSDNPEVTTPTFAERLHVVFQKPRDLEDFLDIYIAIAGISDNANAASLAAAVKATTQVFQHYNSYYYIQN